MAGKRAKGKGKTSIFRKFILALNIIFLLSLIMSFLAAYISPDKYWIPAFFGIAYPLLFLVNVLFLLFWLIFKRKIALILGIILIAGFFNFLKFVQSGKKHNTSNLKEATKIISFNVRNFDIYNYGKNWTFNYTFRNKIFGYLAKEQPDILCFQEYVYDNTGLFETTDSLVDFLKAKNKHIVFTASSRKQNFFGIATYFTYPLIDTGRVDFTTVSGNICIFTDVLINSDTVRIYNVHLESIRFKNEDYMFAERVAKNKNKNLEIKKNSERIFGRLKKAFIARAAQARAVAAHIEKCPYPVILCGDFNDTPTSYAYHTIASKLTDSFIESGNGIGQTYAGLIPFLRIDYIMHGKQFKSYNFETGEELMSDHFPVMCYLKFEKTK